MKMIINYTINMIPYMLISVPIFIIIRLIIFYKNKKINIKREILLLIFYLFLVGLFSQAIIPKYSIDFSKNSINIIPLKIVYDTIAELKKGNIDYLIISLLGNIVMFIPIGFFIKLLWNCSNKKTILLGFLISLFIETSQLFIGRETDVDDLLLNTFGVIIGIVLYKLIKSFNICKNINSTRN